MHPLRKIPLTFKGGDKTPDVLNSAKDSLQRRYRNIYSQFHPRLFLYNRMLAVCLQPVTLIQCLCVVSLISTEHLSESIMAK